MNTTTTKTKSTGMTLEEMVDTLTGHEEVEMEQCFGQLVIPSKDLRSLVFVTLRREGAEVVDAKARVLEMSRKDAKALFVDEDEDIDLDQPDTASGKDGSGPA